MRALLIISVLILLLSQAVAIKAATTVTSIACGSAQSLFLKSDGSFWRMGGDTNKPNQIVSSGVIGIAGGSTGDLYLKSDGSLWVRNSSYIRDGRIASSGVAAIGVGFANGHVLFTKSDGSLWGLGYNDYGQLGDGPPPNVVTSPVQIVSSGAIASAAGANHSLFIKSDGSLWAMGRNKYGQLGDGTTNDVNTPEQIVSSGVIAISAGSGHSLFIKSDGSLWAMGDNSSGQLGDGTYIAANRPKQIVSSGVVAIACGGVHSLLVKSGGSLWAMGDNSSGQLGDARAANGPNSSTNRPEQIVSGGVVAIAAGTFHSLFGKSDGSLWAMGWNGFGQLGDGFPRLSAPGIYDRCFTPEQIVPSPQPVLMIENASKTNLHFNSTCQFAGTFYLLASTNLTQPLSQWTAVWTNFINVRGTNNFTATLTNAVSSGAAQQFYMLQSQ
jgi:alpha-tubulin suppressor-like RCC1 family protein